MDAPHSHPAREPSRLRKTMTRSVIDGGAFAVMMGIGEYYFPAFVLALKNADAAAGGAAAHAEVFSGLISTVPPALGAILQLAAPWAIARAGSNRRWVIACCVVQCLSLIPLAIAALAGTMPPWLLFLVACCYFSSGMAAAAAWSTWIGGYVPRPLHARWYGLRFRVLNLCIVLGFLLGGVILSLATAGVPIEKLLDPRGVIWAFSILFTLALLSRALSTLMLVFQHEPPPKLHQHRTVPFGEFLRRAFSAGSTESRGVRLLIYMFAARFAENLAAPYVTPYLLKQLDFPYHIYALLFSLVLIGKVFAFGPLGALTVRFGPRRVLLVAGLCICPLGWLWLVSSNPFWIAGIQTLSGVSWAGYDLCTWLLILHFIREEERTSLLSVYYLGNWCSVALGALAGGWILEHFGHETGYAWCFTITSFARLFTIPVLLSCLGWSLRESRSDQPPTTSSPTSPPQPPPDPAAQGSISRDE